MAPLILVKGANGMRVSQEKVRQFHDKYGYANPDKPTVLHPEALAFRRLLITEELNELMEANEKADLVAMADGLADLLYVVLGTAVFMGIEVAPIFDEVHRSNMTKELSRDGLDKPIKGAAFERPRIAELLLMQTTGCDESPIVPFRRHQCAATKIKEDGSARQCKLDRGHTTDHDYSA